MGGGKENYGSKKAPPKGRGKKKKNFAKRGKKMAWTGGPSIKEKVGSTTNRGKQISKGKKRGGNKD